LPLKGDNGKLEKIIIGDVFMTAWGALTDFFKQYKRFIGTSSRSAFNWMTWFWSIIYWIIAILIVCVAGLGAFLVSMGRL